MSVFWSRKTQGLSPYIPGEQPKDKTFIKLNTNENPYPPAPQVIEAIHSAAGESLRLYPDPLCGEFREAAARAYGVKPEQVFPGNGSDEALAFAFAAFFESAASGTGSDVVSGGAADGRGADDALLFPDITYSFYPVYANLWDIPFRAVPLADDFSVRIEDYLTPSGGVILPNPNAPTGRALPVSAPAREKGLLSIAEYLLGRGKVLIVDEAYAAFGAESAVPHIGRFPNLLTVHTLSKSASLAGLRAGFAIGSAELVEGLFRVRDSFNSYTMDRLAIAGASAALAAGAYYKKVNAKVIASRERTAAALTAMGFEVVPSKANFLFIRWKEDHFAGRPVSKPPLPDSSQSSPAPLRPQAGLAAYPPDETGAGAFFLKALRERGILVRHFNKPRIADYLRVSIGTDTDMDAFLAACADILRTV